MQIEFYKENHLRRVQRLHLMIAGKLNLSTSDAVSHTQCTLGKWYYGSGMDQFGDKTEFKAIEKAHAKFHQVVKNAIEANQRGENQKAAAFTQEAENLSREVADTLDLLLMSLTGNIQENKIRE